MRRKNESEHIGLGAIRQATVAVSDMKRVLGKTLAGKRILWADDCPGNNVLSIKLLRDAGALVLLVRSTDDAISKLDLSNRTDLVSSDMGREDNPVAGIELLHTMRSKGLCLPVIIYSDSPAARNRCQEINRLGAIGPILGTKNLIAEVARVLQ